MGVDSVLSLLQNKGLSYTVSGKDYLIKCLNPKHEDTNPSLRVDKTSGVAHCFSCGFKRNLFRHFGVFNSNSSVRIAKLKEKLRNVTLEYTELPVPKGLTLYHQSFRGISSATLKRFGASYTHSVPELEDRIIFPISNELGKVVVYCARHVNMDGTPRYLNYPGGRQLPLYPTVFEEKYTSIVLVEGIFDMLNLYDKGIKNAVCVFGTQTLKNGCAEKLLAFKATGVEKVYIMFDGDTPGREAAKELKPIVEECGFIVEIINLPDDMDPGNLDNTYTSNIKNYIAGQR